MGIKEQLKKLRRSLPKGGKLFVLYEGEQVSTNRTEHPGDVEIVMEAGWVDDRLVVDFPDVTSI